MTYDVARAQILLRDLEQMGRGEAHGVQLAPSTEDGPVVRGTCTRLGLLRMAIRLAQAALAARSVVVVGENGAVGRDGRTTEGLLQVFLVEDAPATERPPARFWWLVQLCFALAWVVAMTLCGIGSLTVLRWTGIRAGS